MRFTSFYPHTCHFELQQEVVGKKFAVSCLNPIPSLAVTKSSTFVMISLVQGHGWKPIPWDPWDIHLSIFGSQSMTNKSIKISSAGKWVNRHSMAQQYQQCLASVIKVDSLKKSASRFVTRPSNLECSLPLSVTGKPEKPHFSRSFASSPHVMFGVMHRGLLMKPCSYRLTFSTCATCFSIGILEWIIPMPPSKAIAMAIVVSVTVSMGLDAIGVFKEIDFVKRESSSTSWTPKSICPGMQIKSSKA